MKRLELKTFMKVLVAIAAFSTLFFVACSKDKNLQGNNDVSVSKQISEEEVLLKQAEQVGETVFEHLRLNFLSHKVEEYVNPEIRQRVMSEYKQAQEKYKGLSSEELTTRLLQEKRMTKKQAEYFDKLENTAKELDGITDFTQIESILKNFDKKLIEDKEMPNNDKSLILFASNSIRRTTDYLINIAYQPKSNSDLNTRTICVFGKKLSCVGTIIIGAVKLVYGIVSANPVYIAEGLVGSITAIDNIFSNSACDCEKPCFTLFGISLFRDVNMDCAGNLVRFCAFGEGTFPTAFQWNFAELDQFDQVIASTAVVLPPTSSRCASISPNSNLSKKFRITITTFGFPNCNNGQTQTKSFDFTWGEIVGSPGTVIIDGSSNVYVGNNTTYFLNGSVLVNPKNTFTWLFNLHQGSFTFGNIASGGGNNSSVSINWTGASCGPGAFGQTNSNYYGCYQLGIGGFSANSCSGSQQWGSKSVSVFNY
jgi:hypothetical protein